jgi:WD40 repeat protein
VFATSGQDSAVALWDGTSGKEIKRWIPAPTPTQALSFSPDGEVLASAAGKVVWLWSAQGERIHAFAPAASAAVALSFDRPGTDLGVALNGELAVHRIEKSRYETRRYKWPAACLTVNFSGNGRFLASGMADGTLHFWNRSTGKDSQMRGFDGKLELVAWSDNSRYLASSAGNEVVLWDFSGKGPEGTRPIVLSGHTERVDSFSWQPGSEHFVSAGRDWRLTLWRPAKAKQPIDVQMLDSEISVVRWSPDGKRVAAGEKNGRVTLFDLVARCWSS